MRVCLIFSALLLSACMHGPEIVAAPPPISADLLQPCAGYLGPVPRNDGQLSDALLAEAAGRACANAKIETIRETLRRGQPR